MSLKNATILITGGTGSFGNRVAAHLKNLSPREIRIYSRDEKKQWDMQRVHPDLRYIIGDVRDAERLRDAMRGVDYVFHAAALKQVPSCESYPWEAFKTNSMGSHNLCEAAKSAGVRCVVALSTDKAVKPVNSMGVSKAMMEKVIASQNLFPCETVFCCVRYGNVMGSRGSVIPLFRSLIEAREPLTLTVPEMTRFMMTLDESVELVFHALTNAKGGEIFVRKAPACTVLDLAKTMVKKYSALGENHPISVVGIRPGEKIHEILVNEYEMQRATEEGTFYKVHPEYRLPDLVPNREVGIEYTSENTTRLTDYATIGALLDRIGQVEFSS